THRPRVFAAAAICSGNATPDDVAHAVRTPLWSFHGDADRTVPVAVSRDRMAALRSAPALARHRAPCGVMLTSLNVRTRRKSTHGARAYNEPVDGRECYHCHQWIEPGQAHDCWTTAEAALTADLSEDLRDAWERIREAAVEFGDQ